MQTAELPASGEAQAPAAPAPVPELPPVPSVTLIDGSAFARLEMPVFDTIDGKMVTPQVLDLFYGPIALRTYGATAPAFNAPKPLLHYRGGRIGAQLWRQILSFLQWTYDTWGGESQVRLYYHQDLKDWRCIVAPQQISRGLSTREVQDHPERAAAFAEAEAAGYFCFGTVHHHCAIGAFMSGTDENDERKQNGIHITIGKLNQPQYEFHARISFRGVLYSIDASEWFDFPAAELIAKAPPDVFPAEWKTRMVNEPAQNTAYGYFHGSSWQGGTQWQGSRGFNETQWSQVTTRRSGRRGKRTKLSAWLCSACEGSGQSRVVHGDCLACQGSGLSSRAHPCPNPDCIDGLDYGGGHACNTCNGTGYVLYGTRTSPPVTRTGSQDTSQDSTITAPSVRLREALERFREAYDGPIPAAGTPERRMVEFLLDSTDTNRTRVRARALYAMYEAARWLELAWRDTGCPLMADDVLSMVKDMWRGTPGIVQMGGLAAEGCFDRIDRIVQAFKTSQLLLATEELDLETSAVLNRAGELAPQPPSTPTAGPTQ